MSYPTIPFLSDTVTIAGTPTRWAVILTPFLVLARCQPAVALGHYLYHYQGGRSIYRMRTLPQRGELARRCLAAPAAALGRCIPAALGTAALCALYYRILIPAGSLPAHWLGGALCWN